MKILVLILGIMLCQATSVCCYELFDYMLEKMNEFSNTLARNFNEVGEKVKHFVLGDTNAGTYAPVHSEAIPKNQDPEGKYAKLEMNPTTILSTPQLAALHGKKVETHVISTKDGYLLTLHRIIVDRKLNKSSGTVLLHHGLLGSSADWILLGAKKSLPYILSSNGYDVWMINSRGNYYSRGHIEMKVDCIEYWSFSFHEIGIYDITATVEYIRKMNHNTDQINFIGHSMGATALLALLSSYPKYNDYFRIAIFLAPLVYMNNIKGPLMMISTILKEFGEGEFLPQRKVPHYIAKKYCKGLNIFCTNPLFFFSGMPDYNCWNDSFISKLIYHVPAGGSTNTIIHYQQMAASGRFHKFGDIFSEYPLSEVSVPIAMLSSSEDWLATVPDVLKLFFTIRTPVDNYAIHGRNISHTEFVWGSKAVKLIFPRVLEYLKNGLNLVSTSKNEILPHSSL